MQALVIIKEEEEPSCVNQGRGTDIGRVAAMIAAFFTILISCLLQE